MFKQLEVSCDLFPICFISPYSLSFSLLPTYPLHLLLLPPPSFPSMFSLLPFLPLQEFRAFELLRSGRDRINYLLVKEAKIIAMTCTHAALKRRDLVELAFKV